MDAIASHIAGVRWEESLEALSLEKIFIKPLQSIQTFLFSTQQLDFSIMQSLRHQKVRDSLSMQEV